jgi:hypothetical protein
VDTLRNAKDSLQSGLPISDEASTRQHCLCKEVNAPDLVTVKNFLRFYIATSCGKIDENERPTADSVNAFAEWFFAGFTRITSTPTDEADRSEVYNVSAFPEGRGRPKLIITSTSGKRSLQRVWW